MPNQSGLVSWRIKGEHSESCSCDFVCPCPTSGLSAPPTKGACTFAFVHRIDEGRYGDVDLKGLHFAIVGRTPGPMIEGNWTVGLVTDDRASEAQQQAIVGIASGQAGGPIAALAGLITNFADVESQSIRFEQDGLKRSAKVGSAINQAIEGVAGADQSQPVYLDKVGHPVSTRLALAKATRSHVHAFGVDWDDDSGRNNGHFATFTWSVTPAARNVRLTHCDTRWLMSCSAPASAFCTETSFRTA